MKKTLLLASFIALFATYQVNAQTFVSTELSNRNIVLEEYTGVNCPYCPDGHRVANEVAAANPGKVILINIHAGVYANTTPDYRTSFGESLATQTGLTGYPSGTVNRHVFKGNVTALSRADWVKSVAKILNPAYINTDIEPHDLNERPDDLVAVAPVNVAAKATIDCDTREIVINVEAYYTSNSAVATNKLNVAILQNNVLGAQQGSSYNPSQIINGQYNHMHMLRHLVTGQWGEDITATTKGTFVEKQYTYTAPEHIKNVELALEDLEIVVFIAEGRQEILNGAKAEITLLNAKPKLVSIEEVPIIHCSNARFFTTIKNLSEVAITTVDLTYSLDGVSENITWNARTIASGASDTIMLPVFEANGTHNATVTFNTYNGTEIPSTNPVSASLTKSAVTGDGNMTLKLVTDQYADETSFKVFKEDGSILTEGGPFARLSAVGTTERTFPIEPPAVGCYILEVYDSYGDGINTGYGAGYFQVIDANDEVIINNNGQFGSMARYFIYAASTAAKGKSTSKNSTVHASHLTVHVYPNPTNNTLHIESSEVISQIEIFNLQGQKVISAGSAINVDVSALANGIYLLQVTTEAGVKTEKFVKQ